MVSPAGCRSFFLPSRSRMSRFLQQNRQPAPFGTHVAHLQSRQLPSLPSHATSPLHLLPMDTSSGSLSPWSQHLSLVCSSTPSSRSGPMHGVPALPSWMCAAPSSSLSLPHTCVSPRSRPDRRRPSCRPHRALPSTSFASSMRPSFMLVSLSTGARSSGSAARRGQPSVVAGVARLARRRGRPACTACSLRGPRRAASPAWRPAWLACAAPAQPRRELASPSVVVGR
jgi:hypothetical protein